MRLLLRVAVVLLVACTGGTDTQERADVATTALVNPFRFGVTPASISGLQRWYAADEISGLADGDPVSTWSDQSGNAADLTAAGAARPTLLTSRWNGKPAVVFHGAQTLESASTTGQPTEDFTVFLVVASHIANNWDIPFAWAGSGTVGIRTQYNFANPIKPDIITKAGGAWGDLNAVSGQRPDRGDPIIYTAYRSTTTVGVRIDKGNEVTDTGTGGNIDYGTGVKLMLGSVHGSFPHQGPIFEAVIYNRKLTATEIGQVESYLDRKWKITKDQARFLGWFNGIQLDPPYRIGTMWSPDGRRFRRHLSNPTIGVGAGGTWDDVHVKDPNVIWDGSQYVMYYAGHDGTKFQIGRATSSDGVTWAKYASNPVIAVGSAGADDENGSSFPVVLYEPSDTGREWKIWYAGLPADNLTQRIQYAYSSDGLSFTKHGRVLNVGSSGQFDDVGLLPGAVAKDGSTYNLFYGGRQDTTNPRWQGGRVTFTDPEGTYTKDSNNPVVDNRASLSTALTANLTAGSRTVTVTSTTGFAARDEIVVVDSNSPGEPLRILTVDSATQVTLEFPSPSTFATADGAVMRPWDTHSVIPTAAHQMADGTWELWGTVFQPTTGFSTGEDTREASVRWTAATLAASNWTLDVTTGLLMPVGQVGMWNKAASENPTILERVA